MPGGIPAHAFLFIAFPKVSLPQPIPFSEDVISESLKAERHVEAQAKLKARHPLLAPDKSTESSDGLTVVGTAENRRACHKSVRACL